MQRKESIIRMKAFQIVYFAAYFIGRFTAELLNGI